jgi:hypothetical protein
MRGEGACGEERLAPGALPARQMITNTTNDLNEFFITPPFKPELPNSRDIRVNRLMEP